MTPRIRPGQLFEGRYRFDLEVGRGTFGIVYRALDVETKEIVAIKVLLPWTRADQSLRHRLQREAKLTRLLKSPHAVRIIDLAATADGDLYIVMELLDGKELSELVRQFGPLPPERVAEIGRQVLDALKEAHAMGVIHRDLKPHNVLVCRTAEGGDLAKVLDFGIAKVAGTEDGLGLMETTRLTAPGGILGTPAYMSPEQCRGEPLTPASDFYSLGVVLYEMLTGRPPFDDPNPVQVLMLHNMNPVPPLPSPVAGTPLGRAILRALAKDPQDRFANAEAFIAALNATSSAESPKTPPVAARPMPIAQAFAAVPAAQAPDQPPPAPKGGRGYYGYLVGAAIVILLVLLALSHYFG